MNFHEVIKLIDQERRRQGLSREAVAQRGGFANESNIRRLERPDANPTMETLQRYASAVGVKLRFEVEGMQVLTFFNHAGGVAKTSSVRDIGFVLAESGFRVLLIDIDPQSNLTHWLGIAKPVNLNDTIYPAILGGEELELPAPQHVHGFDLIPSKLDIARIEPQLLGIVMGVTRLRNAIRNLKGYDFVLIDPPPSLGQLSALAVIAADKVVVPVPTNSKGIEGLPTVINMIKEYRQAAPNLGIAMFLLTQFDSRTRHDNESLQSIRQSLAKVAPISSPIHARPAIFKDTQVSGQPLPVFAKGSEADKEVRQVTQELLSALGVSVHV
jgi:chromosome partitioning protein